MVLNLNLDCDYFRRRLSRDIRDRSLVPAVMVYDLLLIMEQIPGLYEVCYKVQQLELVYHHTRIIIKDY